MSADLQIGQEKALEGIFSALKACHAKLAFLFQASFPSPRGQWWQCRAGLLLRASVSYKAAAAAISMPAALIIAAMKFPHPIG
ncbi:MAG: hypothetical protein EA402_12370 [Planctomycetota bacterium]|nr:MAG: hypothetical protein EA402_12370 [Planctomycetota bacterium]